MVAGVGPNGGGGGGEYPGRFTGFVAVTCILGAMGGLIFGYDIGISGGVTSMAPFLKKFFPGVYHREINDRSHSQYCKFDDFTLTAFTSSLYVAAFFASLVASTVTKKFGRKWSMFLGGLIFLSGALLNMFASHVSMLIVGRILLGIGVGFSVQVAIAALIGWKFGVTGDVTVLPAWYAWLVVGLICFYVAGYAWSWGPLGFVVPSEIFPLEIRSAGQSINVSMNMFFTFLIAQLFLTMLCHMKFGLFLFFACFLVGMSVFIYFFLPETKGVPIESVARVFRDHWYWRRFMVADDDDHKGGPGGKKFHSTAV
ncbi:unnamed protein product [Linum tenue]|uniref:Major facilitator superfamily (MFS) profile domain-containing protein n=1 Tax=Linum tenue TaxID=586396 RepID=A0AAV0KLR3_9ROSI|nr:unnamed protein product [Linum tenue]